MKSCCIIRVSNSKINKNKFEIRNHEISKFYRKAEFNHTGAYFSLNGYFKDKENDVCMQQ